jgi:hypothetical protein
MDLNNEGATAEVVSDIPVEEVEKSIDDTLRETLANIRERESTPVEEAKAPESDEEKASRLRDEKGQFAAAPPVVGEAPVIPVIETVADVAPNTWKKEAAAQWAALPPDIKAEIQRREADVHKGIAQYKEAATFGHSMDKAIQPYAQTLQQLGVTPDQAIGELMAADHKLRYGSPTDKQAYFLQLAQNYGIDLGAVQQYADNQPYVDPTTQALQQQVQQLQGWIQNQTQTAQQAEQQALHSEIATFANDPSNKYFDSVKPHMSALLQAGQATDLKDAYDQAVFANPQTRALVLAEQQAATVNANKQKAQAAKTVASGNIRSRPSLPPVAAPLTMDQDIRETFRRLTNGG